MNPFRRSSARFGATPILETPYQRAGQAWDERIGSRIVVDHLFSEAELRLRHGRAGTTVRLVRAGGGT